MPASVPALTASGPACGASSHGSFAFFDPATSSWRTCQHSLFEGCPEFSETWPGSGTMRSGTVFRLPPLVPRISAGGSLSLPTPRANERGQYQRGRGQKGEERLTLTGYAMQGLLPTPTANDAKNSTFPPSLRGRESLIGFLYPTPGASDGTKGGPNSRDGSGTPHLSSVAHKMYPTPRSDGRDNAGGTNSRRTAKANGTYFGRTLNPQFVEWLMGFPIGWTDLGDSAMPLSPR